MIVSFAMHKSEFSFIAFAIISVSAFLESNAALKVQKIGEYSRSSTNGVQMSGITWVGGNNYYVVDDNDGKIYPMTIVINPATGAVTSNSTGNGVTVSGAKDMEGCAYDAFSGKVWISDEGTYNNRSVLANIREVDPETGKIFRKVAIPDPLLDYYSNFSFEALTISGDGKTMWTANEESLVCDGTNSTLTAGSTVRLTKFTRTKFDAAWELAGEWAYLTQPIRDASGQNLVDNARNGVAALTALPDGTLLVLERGYRQWGGLADDFKNYIYQVNFSGATDISGFSSLTNGVPYNRVSKTLLWSDMTLKIVNYEGMCLGPRLNDGSCALVVISDGGSSGNEKIMTLKLTGLDIRTLNFVGPEGCIPLGGPYRYVAGTTATATHTSAGNPYESELVEQPAWALPAHQKTGLGSTASFAITTDDTLTWCTSTNEAAAILAADSFERITAGTEATSLPGWSGDGVVAEASYALPLPPGYPLARETHNGVLMVDGDAERDYTAIPADGIVLDASIRATLPSADSPVADANGIAALHFDNDGHVVLQHRSADGTARLRTILSDRTFKNGDWLRVTVCMNFADGSTWCSVRIDGSACATDAGVRAPGDLASPGIWHRALSDGSRKISFLALKGTGAIDDATLYAESGIPELNTGDGAAAYTNGVPFLWLFRNSLPWDTSFDADGDGADSLSECAAGTDPWDASDFFHIIDASFNAAGQFVVKFTGSADVSSFHVRAAASLGTVVWPIAEGTLEKENGVNVWIEKFAEGIDQGSRFFKVIATPPGEMN